MLENGPEETAAMIPRRGARLRSVLLSAVILVCGAILGSVATIVAYSQHPVRNWRDAARTPDRIAQEMQQKYQLTDAQEQALKTIFEEHGKKLMAIREEVQPRVETEHEALQRAVESVLPPEQAAQWRAEFEQMRRPWHGRGGGAAGRSGDVEKNR